MSTPGTNADLPAQSALSSSRGPLPPDAGIASRVALVAVVVWLGIDAVRASGPVLDRAFNIGTLQVAGAALGTYLIAPAVATALFLLLTGRRGAEDGSRSGATVLLAVSALGLSRLVMQVVTDQAKFAIGLLTAALAVSAVVLTISRCAGRRAGGRQAAVGMLLGIGLSVGTQAILGTWDAVWRQNIKGLAVAVVMVFAAVVLAVITRADDSTGRPRRSWALGPAFALILMVLANPAFIAAQSRVSLIICAAVLVLSTAAAIWLLLVPGFLTPVARAAAIVALPVLTAAAFFLPNVGALIAVGLAEVSVGIVLAETLTTRRPAPPGAVRTVLATGAVGGLLIVVLLVYLLDYDVPLGVDNAWVVIAGAILLALSGLRLRIPGANADPQAGKTPAAPPLRANSLRFLVLPAVLLLLLGWWRPWYTTPEPAGSPDDSLRVMDWNLHYGVALDTRVDLEQIAEAIESEQPDVVMLQEVARGWVLGGGVDMATWLADRLGMEIAFAPAADPQFGNALLSRTPLNDVQAIELPYGEGPQHRSALTARVQTAGGTWVRVTTVHLQHRDENTDTRLQQLDALAAALPNDGPSVLSGDLNAEPGWPELTMLGADGWISAVDTVGDPSSLTFATGDLYQRIDWIFGREVTFTAAGVLDSDASDHLALVAQVQVP